MRGIMTGCPFPSHRGAVTPAQRGEKGEEVQEEELEKGKQQEKLEKGGGGGEVRKEKN